MENTPVSNIDWAFISEKEGGQLTQGYVPNAEGSKSGVTIATGFDLGERTYGELTNGLPKSLANKLKPFLGKKGKEAEKLAPNLTITEEEAQIIDEFSKKQALDKLSKQWKKATGTNFEDLPKHKATPIASVAFQYGNLPTKTPNFWKQVTNDDWDGAIENLLDFEDDYPTRRKSEADYYLQNIDSDLIITEEEEKDPIGDLLRKLGIIGG